MGQRRFELDVPQWREVLLLRATFIPFFLTACGRWALAAAGIEIRTGVIWYEFPNNTYSSRRIFAYPQPSTGRDFGIAQFDGQAGMVQSLLATSLVLGFLDWIPFYFLARHKDNPVWADGWKSRFIILAFATVPVVQLSIAIVCWQSSVALVHSWLQASAVIQYRDFVRTTYPDRNDLDPKRRELDPFLAVATALAIVSFIDATMRWVNILTLRVVPTSWRFRQRRKASHLDTPYELEDLQTGTYGPVAKLFFKQQNRRMSVEHQNREVIVRPSDSVEPAQAAFEPQANMTARPGPGSGRLTRASVYICRSARIPREYHRIFLNWFIEPPKWHSTVFYLGAHLLCNLTHIGLEQRPGHTCKAGCGFGLIYPTWWIATVLAISAVIRHRISFHYKVRGTIEIARFIAVFFWIGLALTVVGVVLMMTSDSLISCLREAGNPETADPGCIVISSLRCITIIMWVFTIVEDFICCPYGLDRIQTEFMEVDMAHF